MNYFLSSIVRTRKFNSKVSELLFKRPMFFRYKAGDKVTLPDYNKKYYIASGVQEPWARIIIDNSVYINTPTIRIEREPTNDIPTLIGTEPSKTVIICNDLGIGPALAFCSTYPTDKLAAIYYKHVGEGVNIDWLKGHQNVHEWKQLAASSIANISTEPDYNYYICCNDRENALVKDHLLNKGVSEQVMFTSDLS